MSHLVSAGRLISPVDRFGFERTLMYGIRYAVDSYIRYVDGVDLTRAKRHRRGHGYILRPDRTADAAKWASTSAGLRRPAAG